MLTLNDGRTELWQWDTGRTLTVDADCSQVHFSNKVFGRSIDVDVAAGTAIIPDVLLQTDKELTAWAFVGTPENGYTKISKVFKVNRRNKPADYVFTPPDQTTLKEVLDRLEEVENKPAGGITSDSITEALGYVPGQELVMGNAKVNEEGRIVVYVPTVATIKTGALVCYRLSSQANDIASDVATINGKTYLFVSADSSKTTLNARELHENNDTIIIRIDEEIGDPLFAQVIAVVPKEQEVPDFDGVTLSDCYKTERVDYGVAQETLKTDYLIDLYNKLVADHPDCVSVEAISADDGSFTNYAYTFSLGEYNTKGVRGELDTYIKKPKYLVLSGIHGREKTAVMATYHFFRDLAEGKNVPVNFREGAIFKIMPVGNPFGFNQKGIGGASEPDFGRANANGVDINRNFDYNWSSDATGNRNPGEYAGSEKETQVIMKWLEANKDASLFIDHHNSSSDDYNEVAMVVGLNTDSIKQAKHTALRGLDRIIPSWRLEIDNGEKVYSYSSFVDAGGTCIYYANEVVGIPSLALETCTRQDDPNTSLTPVSIAIGAEAVGNILLEFYEQADYTNYAEEGKFAVSDGKGGIKWLSLFNENEVGY